MSKRKTPVRRALAQKPRASKAVADQRRGFSESGRPLNHLALPSYTELVGANRLDMLPRSAWREPSRDAVFGIGKRVRDLRISLGITQEQLGSVSRMSKDKISAVELERNRGALSLKNAIRLAKALDTSLDYLAGLTRDPTPRR